jgi:hypothetical protein
MGQVSDLGPSWPLCFFISCTSKYPVSDQVGAFVTPVAALIYYALRYIRTLSFILHADK